jgi:hypothetical protein
VRREGIGGDGEYCGDNDARLDRTNVLYNGAFYHEASGGKYVTCVVIFDLEPGVIGPGRASLLGELFRPEKVVNENAGAVRYFA